MHSLKQLILFATSALVAANSTYECKHGEYSCTDYSSRRCNWGKWVDYNCPAGTYCIWDDWECVNVSEMKAHPSFIYYGADKNQCSDLISGTTVEKTYEETTAEEVSYQTTSSVVNYSTPTPVKKAYETSAPILIATPSEVYSTSVTTTPKVYSTPSPVYSKPTPKVYSTPSPVYSKPTPKVYSTPSPVYTAPATYKVKTRSYITQTTQAYQSKASYITETTETVETTAAYPTESIGTPIATPSLYEGTSVETSTVSSNETISQATEAVAGGIAPIGGVLPMEQQAAGTKGASLSVCLAVLVCIVYF